MRVARALAGICGLAWAMMLGTAGAVSAQTAATSRTVFVPSFIDPQHHVEKPEPGAVQTIRFLTTDDYPPFNFPAPDGSLTGFNVDLARAVCEELKIACSIQARPWDSLIPALNAKAGDAIIASVAMTAQTRADLDFSFPTMKTPARFTARTGSGIMSVLPESIGQTKIGVQGGTAHAAYLAAYFPKANVRSYTDPNSLRSALRSGEIDVMFADGIATALWLNGTASGGCCAFVGGPFTESRFFGEGSGIAVRKGDLVLRDALNSALDRLTARGVLADLYLRYFPVDPY